MSRRNFHATTALGLCLALVPLPSFAQSTDTGLDEAELFVPPVQACIDEPTVMQCQDLRAVIIDCAEDLEQARCARLFVEVNAVFENPEQFEQAQRVLSEASEAMAQLDFGEAVSDDTPDAAEQVEERLDLELERGAEEVLDTADPSKGDAEPEFSLTEPELEAEGEADEQAQRDEETEERLREALEAEQLITEGEPEDAVEAEAPTEAVEDDQGAEESDPDTLAEDEQRLRDILEAEQHEVDGTGEADGTDAELSTEEALDREEIERDLEEERVQMRADAEAMAEDEPELLVEDVPEEEFVAPSDEQRELDAEQQTMLDRLMDDPETAAAVTLLSQMADESNGSAAEDQPETGFATALSALQRSRTGEVTDDEEVAQAEEVTEDEITAAEIRTSRDDFDSRFALDFDAGQARSSDRRDLERAGLVALGALAVGMIVNRNRVVARSDERVVVMRDDGEYAVWRDDDVILGQDGSQRRIERYADGSTLTRWARNDGSEIVTIRDATGRVLWRERVLADGTSIELVNDMREVDAIDASVLPPPRRRELRMTQRTDPDLAIALLQEAEADARAVDRAFTLRQIREVREVRELVPVLSPDPITFEINRANVRPEEARKLSQVGRLMERLISDNPREMFLIEGHTDATGPASYNLALSDRRAESVALALTEFFEIPPENLIIQGYGERYLRIPTAAAEERNRRVAIRRISPLLGL